MSIVGNLSMLLSKKADNQLTYNCWMCFLHSLIYAS